MLAKDPPMPVNDPSLVPSAIEHFTIQPCDGIPEVTVSLSESPDGIIVSITSTIRAELRLTHEWIAGVTNAVLQRRVQAEVDHLRDVLRKRGVPMADSRIASFRVDCEKTGSDSMHVCIHITPVSADPATANVQHAISQVTGVRADGIRVNASIGTGDTLTLVLHATLRTDLKLDRDFATGTGANTHLVQGRIQEAVDAFRTVLKDVTADLQPVNQEPPSPPSDLSSFRIVCEETLGAEPVASPGKRSFKFSVPVVSAFRDPDDPATLVKRAIDAVTVPSDNVNLTISLLVDDAHSVTVVVGTNLNVKLRLTNELIGETNPDVLRVHIQSVVDAFRDTVRKAMGELPVDPL
jgi:hypothetical protein